MNETELFAKAVAFAAEKHGGQTRRNGTPYIYHPVEVARIVRDAGYGLKYQTAAVLHDVLEDTDATEDDVRIFGEDVLEAVKILTRPEGADEAEYVENILGNNMAAVVKNADKIHNLWDCVRPDAPGTRRKPEDIAFANKYIKKSKIYYEDKFSSALDMAIGNAEAEMEWTTVQKPDRTCGDTGVEMELYMDREARINSPEAKAERKARLHDLYDRMLHRPDFSDDNTRFAELDRFGETEYFCYVRTENNYGSWSIGRTWELCMAGWIVTPASLQEHWDDVYTLSREEILAVIEKKKSEGYFYDFVEENLL